MWCIAGGSWMFTAVLFLMSLVLLYHSALVGPDAEGSAAADPPPAPKPDVEPETVSLPVLVFYTITR